MASARPSFRLRHVDARNPQTKRRAQRYPLSLRVELAHGAGVTSDVSIAGVYLVTDQQYSVGAPIEFTLVFGEATPETMVRLNCHGTVVRVEPREAGVGVAVAIRSYRFAAS